MNYALKTLSQLPLVIKGFRQLRGLTQAAMAEKLGITQQSYAYFEANPATAKLDRLFVVLRLLDVEISLDQAVSATSMNITPSTRANIRRIHVVKTARQKISKTARAATIKKEKPSAVINPSRIISTARKKESW